MKSISLTKKLLCAALAVVMTAGASAMSVSAVDIGTIDTKIESVLPINGSCASLTLDQTYSIPEYISSLTGIIYDISVSNNGVLTYNDGKITASAVGTGMVTVTFKSGKKLSFTFNVKAPEKEITLDQSKLSMKVGQSSKLSARLKDSSGKIIWKSSDTRVVSVDQNGKLKARGSGIAVVSAATDEGVTASCHIYVEDPISDADITIPVQSVSLDKREITLKVGKRMKINATVSPANATEKTLTYTIGNPKVAKVSNGYVTAKRAGRTKLTVKSSNGKKAVCIVNVVE